MSVLLWIAVLIGVWCVASVATALTLGTFLRRRHEATDPEGALRPLDLGPVELWTGHRLDVPDTLAGLDDVSVPAPRRPADATVGDRETVR